MAGQSCGLVGDILPAAELMQRVMREAEQAIAHTCAYQIT